MVGAKKHGINLQLKVCMVRELLREALACRPRRGRGEECLFVKLSDKSILIHNQITKDGIRHQYAL